MAESAEGKEKGLRSAFEAAATGAGRAATTLVDAKEGGPRFMPNPSILVAGAEGEEGVEGGLDAY